MDGEYLRLAFAKGYPGFRLEVDGLFLIGSDGSIRALGERENHGVELRSRAHSTGFRHYLPERADRLLIRVRGCGYRQRGEA